MGIFSGIGYDVVGIAEKLIFAAIVLFAGKWVIQKCMALLSKSKAASRLEGTVRTFVLSFVKIALYVILVISVISILGVPMASVVTILASAGVSIGLALQGALSNLAGGIMLLIFKPFKVGDFIDAAGASGTVAEVSLFYTVLLSVDNKRITVPNGALMNTNVTDYSAEAKRRVDLTVTCGRGESPRRIQELILSQIKNDKIVTDTAVPAVLLVAQNTDSLEFQVRVWCASADYWDVYFDLMDKINEALVKENVKTPAIRVINDK